MVQRNGSRFRFRGQLPRSNAGRQRPDIAKLRSIYLKYEDAQAGAEHGSDKPRGLRGVYIPTAARPVALASADAAGTPSSPIDPGRMSAIDKVLASDEYPGSGAGHTGRGSRRVLYHPAIPRAGLCPPARGWRDPGRAAGAYHCRDADPSRGGHRRGRRAARGGARRQHPNGPPGVRVAIAAAPLVLWATASPRRNAAGTI